MATDISCSLDKKFEQIKSKLFESPNVMGVGLGSNKNEPLGVSVILRDSEANFPTEIDSVMMKNRVIGNVTVIV